VILASIIDWDALWQTVWTAGVAGIGTTIVFSFAVLGATRSQDMQRQGRGGLTVAYGALAVVSLAATLAAIAFAIVLISTK
jgi:hypothetical protein